MGVLEQARAHGFLGPGPVEPHIAHALGFAGAFPEAPAAFVDLGSGGGVPGLVLLDVWPDARGVLLDANERRTGFLVEAIAELGWGSRAEVVRLRAEDAGRDARFRAAFPAVVARGFAPPPVTAECAAPLLAVGGTLVVSEPPEETSRWPAAGLERLGLVDAGVHVGPARFQVLRQEALCPELYPRRVGLPGKRPLW
jgi:16S rRNA (guanine527-N7)-methyltransferase